MHKYILALTLALAVNQIQASWFTGFGAALSKNSNVIGAFAAGVLVSGLVVYLWQSKYVINPLKKENDYLKKDNEGKANVIRRMSNSGAKPITVNSKGTQQVLDAFDDFGGK